MLEKKELKVPEKLAKAYTELLSAFEEEKTIPTLAYLGGGLKSFVSAYIEAFKTVTLHYKMARFYLQNRNLLFKLVRLKWEEMLKKYCLRHFTP